MQTLKLIVSILCLLIFSACSQRHWQVQGETEEASKSVMFVLHFSYKQNVATWVCYTEIENHILQAASCQNDTALPLFSAGRMDSSHNDAFEFSLLSKRLLLVSPENTLAYLQIALYPAYKVDSNQNNSKPLEIHKISNITTIIDSLNHLKVEIDPL